MEAFRHSMRVWKYTDLFIHVTDLVKPFSQEFIENSNSY